MIPVVGPLVGGALVTYFEGPTRREAVGIGAQAGIVGGPAFVIIINRYSLYSVITNNPNSPPLNLLLASVVVYVFALSTLGGYVGARLKASHGESEPSRNFERTEE
jgi:hypothetical protein